MSTTIVIPKRTGKKHCEKLKNKSCKFPGCKKVFKGTGKSCYCHIHRDRKYRKIIDAGKVESKKAAEEAKNPNLTLKHNYKESIILKMKCRLEGCGKEFDITVYPNVFCYPKFCENHRNSWKRELFLNKNKESVDAKTN